MRWIDNPESKLPSAKSQNWTWTITLPTRIKLQYVLCNSFHFYLHFILLYLVILCTSWSWFKWITGYTGYWISTTISKLPLIYSSQSHVILGARGLGTVSGMSEVSKTFVWDHTSGEPGWIFLSPQRSYSAETLSGIFWQKVRLDCSICSSWTLEPEEKTLRQGRWDTPDFDQCCSSDGI